ncbi:FemAB family PEP-CTERM system-associated protein [Erythrobacter arachoides]|uniref:FemAB family PEP-CTERM system-associated protein n=1 Tax=Aurantiacibacter arachoides TaxID=1850444 RepID=A0A845A0H6_9SPHN|nr:FemAB family XrtA/PEP-CTERM system-associated protein [Aurantiacibacter arachoides]MXO93040.1 FemAB family PEP-CTERM system-associated protein [Aurantiacibacter arachoides]GGD52481.1 peptidoglycan bridge formation protein FemAB [Aurantiacibacter arachoides]
MNAPFALLRETARAVDFRHPGEAERIERFVVAHGGSVFHRPAWLEAVEHGTGQRARGLVAEKGAEITGWLPLTEVHSPLFGRVLASSGFAVEGGVLAGSQVTALRLCDAAMEMAVRLSCPSAELRGPAAGEAWTVRTDSHCGFVHTLASDDDAQLLAIPRKQRAEVRKGLSADLEVSTGASEADRAAHHAVYAESVRNLGTPVFPRALFDAVLDTLDADILTVWHRGIPVASVLSLYHGGAVMPYWGGGTQAARVLRANDRMYYELMLHARRRGCTRFDFGRSKTGSGAAAFKKNWGFEAEPLAYASWTAPGHALRDADPTSERHQARIALWKRLPLPIANWLGPWIARGLG